MEYAGKYPYFDSSKLTTYPIDERPNVLHYDQLIWPESTQGASDLWTSPELEDTVSAVLNARKRNLPVICFSGAHTIKLGHSPLFIDLMQRGIITLFATNGAGSIHDFEMALIGETSENVPNALPSGQFGMAYETGKFMNDALAQGNQDKIGYGEALGRLIATGEPGGVDIRNPEISIFGQAWELGIPATVHTTMGTDIIDQHPSFDGQNKGGCSGRDFGVFAEQVRQLKGGGVVLNIGSAVTGPEVLLKTVSMASNIGCPPEKLITANFDLRAGTPKDIVNPGNAGYYYRDIKSVITRIPQAFGGSGYMVAGNFMETIPAFYELLTK